MSKGLLNNQDSNISENFRVFVVYRLRMSDVPAVICPARCDVIKFLLGLGLS